MIAHASHRLTFSRGHLDIVFAATFVFIEVEQSIDLEGVEPGELDIIAKLDQAGELGAQQVLDHRPSSASLLSAMM